MISDSECRAVAARMREIMRRCPDCFLDDMVAQSILDVIGEGVVIGETVADLIDRPTCFDTESKDSKSFTCSACGFSESKLVVSPFTLSFSSVKPSYRYCPKCGARVVRGDADRLKGGVRTSYERDTRIPYRLGTDHYCEFEDGGGFVHMGDTVEVCEDCYDGQFSCTGKLLYVEYGSDGFITLVRISCPSDENDCVCVDCDGVFFKPEKGAASD